MDNIIFATYATIAALIFLIGNIVVSYRYGSLSVEDGLGMFFYGMFWPFFLLLKMSSWLGRSLR
jgi:hypothetical protein